MHYSSGILGLGSIAVAQTLPTEHLLWLAARVLLDAAGGLFLLYLVLISGTTAAVLLSPRSRRSGGTGLEVPRPTHGRHRARKTR